VGVPDGDPVALVDDAGHHDPDRARLESLRRGGCRQPGGHAEDGVDDGVRAALRVGRVPFGMPDGPARVDERALHPGTTDIDGNNYAGRLIHGRITERVRWRGRSGSRLRAAATATANRCATTRSASGSSAPLWTNVAPV